MNFTHYRLSLYSSHSLCYGVMLQVANQRIKYEDGIFFGRFAFVFTTNEYTLNGVLM